jgi:hypothetical protein
MAGSTIANLNVRLTASTNQFDASMSGAGGKLATVRAAFDRATNAAAAYEGMANSVGELKLAGADTLRSFQTTLAVADPNCGSSPTTPTCRWRWRSGANTLPRHG